VATKTRELFSFLVRAQVKDRVERSFMARKLKTYQASVGFFDIAIAAPSIRAALEAWGSNTTFPSG
jgi:hypothetical protein